MTTLAMPSLEGRLLRTVAEQVTTEPIGHWPRRRLQLCLNLVREIRQSAIEARQALEEELREGVEARSFASRHGRDLSAAEEYVAISQQLIDLLSETKEPGAESLVAELRLFDEEERAFRDFLAEALSMASRPARPVDWGRIRAAEEAATRGETKPFFRS